MSQAGSAHILGDTSLVLVSTHVHTYIHTGVYTHEHTTLGWMEAPAFEEEAFEKHFKMVGSSVL